MIINDYQWLSMVMNGDEFKWWVLKWLWMVIDGDEWRLMVLMVINDY